MSEKIVFYGSAVVAGVVLAIAIGLVRAWLRRRAFWRSFHAADWNE
jgi:hypothetical protein